MALFDRPCHTVSEILDLLLVTGTPACRAACRYVVYPVVQNVFFAHRREGADIIFSPVVRRRYCCSYYHPEARHRRPRSAGWQLLSTSLDQSFSSLHICLLFPCRNQSRSATEASSTGRVYGRVVRFGFVNRMCPARVIVRPVKVCASAPATPGHVGLTGRQNAD